MPRDPHDGMSQADAEFVVRYLEWDQVRKTEWIKEAARLAVDAFLDEEDVAQLQGRSPNPLDSADTLRP